MRIAMLQGIARISGRSRPQGIAREVAKDSQHGIGDSPLATTKRQRTIELHQIIAIRRSSIAIIAIFATPEA
jgi:hypothetical protein